MAKIEFLSQVPSRFALEKLYDVELKDMTTANVDTKLKELETMDKENINTKLLTYFVKEYKYENTHRMGSKLTNSKEIFIAKCKEYFVNEYLQLLKDNFTKNYTDRDAEPTLDNHRTHFEEYAQEKVEQAMAKTPGGKKRSIRRKKSIRKRKNARKSRRR
jgi:hypothetical protein